MEKEENILPLRVSCPYIIFENLSIVSKVDGVDKHKDMVIYVYKPSV
jgi:hypothetical protein